MTPSADTTAILFLDLQDGIVRHSKTAAVHDLKRTAGVLAKLAALHGLPVYLSAVPPGGEYLSAVTDALPDAKPRMRTQTTAFADAGLVEALRNSGRKLLVLAGVASEIVVQRTALDALEAGYAVQIAVDACGGFSERTEAAAFARVAAAGGVTTSVITLGAELAGDFTSDAGGETLKLVYQAAGV